MTPTVNAQLAHFSPSILSRFEAANAARDVALNDGRQVIRLAANAIRATHRGDTAEAERLRAEGLALLQRVIGPLGDHPAIYWAGYVQDAMKEAAEAHILAAIVEERPIPGPEDLGIEDAPYLNGLAEAASELRRTILDTLRGDDVARAESLLAAMDEIYGVLVTVDFPDAITGGLRRTTDQLRAVLERTRGDVTLTVNQRRLERAIGLPRAATETESDGE